MTEQSNADLIAEAITRAELCDADSREAMRDTGRIILRLTDALEAADLLAETVGEQRDELNRMHRECHDQRDQLAAVVEQAREWAENVLPMEDAVALRDILATTPADALREVKADVWASGYNAGYSDRSTSRRAIHPQPLQGTRGTSMSTTDEFEPEPADWMGEQDWTVNVRDYTDECETYVREQPVELLAERLMQSSWLAEHDAKVRAEALWEAAARLETDFGERIPGGVVLSTPSSRRILAYREELRQEAGL